MDLLTLKLIHVAGVIGLAASLGATQWSASENKSAKILHGICLLVIAGAGFAMLKKPPMGQYWWMIKLALWLWIGLAPALSKKQILGKSTVLILTLVAAIIAAWLGLTKPF